MRYKINNIINKNLSKCTKIRLICDNNELIISFKIKYDHSKYHTHNIHIRNISNIARVPLIGTCGYGLHSMKNTYQRGIKRRFGRLSHSNINLIHSGPITRDCNFIMARQSYLTSADDIKRATSMDYHKKLEHNDISYLKSYEKLYGPRFHGLYEATIKLRDEYDDVFAKHVYSRRTMKVEPVRLGIMPQYRKYQCYVPQYPMTQLKRDWMIVYTIE